MTKTILITSGKGGVGKTTITAYLAYILSEHNKRVCIVDADIGLKNMDTLLGIENRVLYDGEDILAGRCTLEKALVQDKRMEHVYLLTLKRSLKCSTFAMHDFVSLMILLRSKFDYILVDSPAGIESGFQFGVEICDEVLLVTQLEATALQDADRVVALIHQQSKPVKIIYNRVSPPLIKRGIQMDLNDAHEFLCTPLGGIVYECEELLHTSNKGMLPKLKKGMVYQCFYTIMQRLEDPEYPLPYYIPKSLLSKLIG